MAPRYKLSFRDVAEMLLQRGFEVTHETIGKWEFRFAPLLADTPQDDADRVLVRERVPLPREEERPHRLAAEAGDVVA